MHAEKPGDECALVRSVQRGDGEAFAELFRRHYPSVLRACSRRLSDPVDADEVAQAAFVRAFERIDQCAGDRRFGAWVHVIARSLCMDAFRAQARVEPWEVPPIGPGEHRPNEPEESVLSRERAAQVQQALASLPDSQRRAVVARDWDEMRPGEIADRLGLSVGAVDSLLLRGRRRLALAYRRLAGEAGGGATVLPVRSAAATIVAALAVAPHAVMAGTAAAAQAVQDGASRAADGVAGAVISLALGISGAAAPAPPPTTVAPAVVTTVVGVAERPPSPTAPAAGPVQEATPAPAPPPAAAVTPAAASATSASDPTPAVVVRTAATTSSATTTVPGWAGTSATPALAPEAGEPPAKPEPGDPAAAPEGPTDETPSTSPPAAPVVAVELPPVPLVPDVTLPALPTGPALP